MATDVGTDRSAQARQLAQQVRDFLASHDPASTEPLEFLRARYDAGLAWVNFPSGLGGQGLDRSLQADVDDVFAAAGAPDNNSSINVIGLGMAAPTILAYASEEDKKRLLRPLWTGEDVWCQMFSEPGAGSDLAGLATSAVKQSSGDWLINGQKVWTSSGRCTPATSSVAPPGVASEVAESGRAADDLQRRAPIARSASE